MSGISFFSRSLAQENYIERLASVKIFFKSYRLVKWASYCNLSVCEISKAVKEMEAPFNIPKMLVNASILFNPNVCAWKRVSSGIKMMGSGAYSMIWANKQVSKLSDSYCLGETSCEILEKVSLSSKFLYSCFQIVYAICSLFHISRCAARSRWESREQLSTKIAWIISLLKNMIKLLLCFVFGVFFLPGIAVTAPLQLFARTIVLVLSVSGRFFDKNAKKYSPNILWGGSACQLGA
ncbi:MAG: hypothetical protein V4494_00300 [Chlamydiota bacterium]